MLVLPVGTLKFSHQVSQGPVGQRLVHQVLAPAHSQRPVAAIAVHPQNHMVEAVTRELGLKADGEALQCGQPVGQVAAQKLLRIRTPPPHTHTHTEDTEGMTGHVTPLPNRL